MSLYHKSDIGQGGIISKIEYISSEDSQSVTYGYIHLRLCNTSKETLETTFNNNYDGNDPVYVFSGSNYNISGNKDTWVPFEFNLENFKYDGSKNLIVEVGWTGCSEAGLYNYVFNTNGIHTIYAYNQTVNANEAQYSLTTANMIRLTIEYTNIEYTSLGVLKSLYR